MTVVSAGSSSSFSVGYTCLIAQKLVSCDASIAMFGLRLLSPTLDLMLFVLVVFTVRPHALCRIVTFGRLSRFAFRLSCFSVVGRLELPGSATLTSVRLVHRLAGVF